MTTSLDAASDRAPGARLLAAALVAALAAGTLALYTTRLAAAPRHMLHDELQFALQAESIAASGRDLSGRVLPLFFTEPEFPAGRDPIVIYATAAALAWLPLSEASARLPTALVGTLDVLLACWLASRLFRGVWAGVVAGAMLAMTPAHFMHSRLALSIVYPLPFILAWLLCLERATRGDARRAMAAAGAALGLATYSYLGAVVLVPIFALLTVVWARRRGEGATAWRLAAACGLALVPMVLWHVAYPERVTQIVDAYRLLSAPVPEGTTAAQGVYEFVRTRLSLAWAFFSPEYLFVSGDASVPNSTREAGYFPWPLLPLMVAGVVRIGGGGGGPLGWIVLAGLVAAPLPGIVSGQLEMNRVLAAAPFGVLVAAYGVDALWRTRKTVARVAAAGLVLAVPWQFARFHADYLGPYQDRAARWFGGDLRGAVSAAIDLAGEGRSTIYLGSDIPYVQRYWRFYAIAKGRRDLAGQPVLVDPGAPDAAAGDGPALALCRAASGCDRFAGAKWRVERTVGAGDGEAFAVYRRP